MQKLINRFAEIDANYRNFDETYKAYAEETKQIAIDFLDYIDEKVTAQMYQGKVIDVRCNLHKEFNEFIEQYYE